MSPLGWNNIVILLISLWSYSIDLIITTWKKKLETFPFPEESIFPEDSSWFASSADNTLNINAEKNNKEAMYFILKYSYDKQENKFLVA